MRKQAQKMGSVLAVALLLFTYSPLVAAASGSIGIIPAYPQAGNTRSKGIFIHTLNGGDTAEDGVKVFNYTEEERTVVIGAVDSVAASDGSFSCKQNTEKRVAVGTWIKLDADKVVIPAKSNKTVNFTITVPKDAGPGEHDGCITAQDTQNFAPKTGQGVLLGFRNAIRLAVTVPGDIVKKLDYQRVDIKQVPSGDYSVSPVLKNAGNVSLDVKARVQLRGIFGEETDIKSADFPVISGATTGWAFSFKRPFWGGLYRAYTSVSYNANPNDGIGVNTADQKSIRKDTGYFVMMPAPLGLAVELGIPILLLFVLITFLHRKRRRRMIQKKWQRYTVKVGDTLIAIAADHAIKWKYLAKVNHVKAPYQLNEGMTLLVPLKGSLKKKRRRFGRAKWNVEAPAPTPTVAAAPPLAADIPATEPVGAENVAEPRPQTHPVSTPHETVAEQLQTTVRQYQASDWALPGANEPEDGLEGPDWREGASEEELRSIEALHDTSAVPQLNSSWSLDAEENEATPPVRKSPAKKRAATTKKSKTAARKKTKKT